MKKKAKIVLIGAGSKEFSKGLIHDLVLDKELREKTDLEVVLVDLDSKLLKNRHEYALRCAETTGASIEFKKMTDRRQALPDTDFVLLSVAIGRMELWEQDFRIPAAFGVKHIYGENGGPGALFHALRNYKILFPILRDVEKLCPQARLINLTNPEARVLSAILTLTKLKAIGLCHGFYSFHELVHNTLEYESENLDIRTAGMNHFYTYYKIADRRTGEDLIPQFEELINRKIDRLPPVVRYLWENFGVLGYVSDHHAGEYIGHAYELTGRCWKFGIESRKVLHRRAGVDSAIAFEAWREGKDVESDLAEDWDEDSIVPSGELAVPIIGDILLDRKELRASVNVLNTEGYIENLARDGCIEVPAIVDRNGVHPEFVGSLPEGFAAQIRLQHSIAKLLVEAYSEHSKKKLLQALLLDPVAVSPLKAREMLDYMLDIQSEYLPGFH